MHPLVVILGCPNVGKSRLFNRLTQTQKAIVEDTPGVTHDVQEALVEDSRPPFRLVDTPGLFDPEAPLDNRLRDLTEPYLKEATVFLFVINGRTLISEDEKNFLRWLRRYNRPILLLANKCEGRLADKEGFADSLSLGVTPTIPISAEHGSGIPDLEELITAILQKEAPLPSSTEDLPPPFLRLSIVGKPNVGKSTLLNRILGKERVLTGPEAGLTRDPIEVRKTVLGKEICFIDTAGLRRPASVQEPLEKMMVRETRAAVQYSHVVVALMDATDPLSKQDARIFEWIVREGRGLVIGVNKWDAASQPEKAEKGLRRLLDQSLPQLPDVPFVFLSGKTGYGVEALLQKALDVYERLQTRIPTQALNRFLGEVTEQHLPPLVAGRRIRLKYLTQTKIMPPTFRLFGNKVSDLPRSYESYILKKLRKTFDLEGIPLRLLKRSPSNPFDAGKKS